jgi:uncharacterized membrane protein YciS (DUF1049 family)
MSKESKKSIGYERWAKALIAISIVLIVMMVVISKGSSNWKWLEYVYYIAGVVIPLITLSSVLLVLATLILQKNQLQIQKDEIKRTQDDIEIQNKTTRLQRFDSIFFLLVEQMNKHYKFALNQEPQKFKNIIVLLNSEIKKEFDNTMKEYDVKELTSDEIDKLSYKAIYNSCLNTEKRYLGLGLGPIYSYFVQIIELIIQSKSFLDESEVRYYFDFITLELREENILKLITYRMIYDDRSSVIKFLDESDLIKSINNIMSPISLYKGRSMWEYITKHTGNLDPYPIKELIKD